MRSLKSFRYAFQGKNDCANVAPLNISALHFKLHFERTGRLAKNRIPARKEGYLPVPCRTSSDQNKTEITAQLNLQPQLICPSRVQLPWKCVNKLPDGSNAQEP